LVQNFNSKSNILNHDFPELMLLSFKTILKDIWFPKLDF